MYVGIEGSTFWKAAKASGVTYSATAMWRFVGRMYCPSVTTSTPAHIPRKQQTLSELQPSVASTSSCSTDIETYDTKPIMGGSHLMESGAENAET